MLTPAARRLLTKTRTIIADPKRWVKRVYAIDKNGEGVDPTSSTACKFCVLGALHHVDGGRFTPSYWIANTELHLASPFGDVTRDNDGPDGRVRVLGIIDEILEKK